MASSTSCGMPCGSSALILVTVGTQLPFDRLIESVDRWAKRTGRRDIVAQVGPTSYRPGNMEWHDFISPDRFQELQADAELLIAHCGMGSILSALVIGQPVLVMPRRHALGEHRSDHQLDTARRLSSLAGVHVALDPQQLSAKLDQLSSLAGSRPIPCKAPPEFSARLASFIAS